jgi:hypothetical protein
MRINSRGDVAHGIGGLQASVNNVPFAKGWVGGWINDDTIVYVNGDDNWSIWAWHRPSDTRERLSTASATALYAGGGIVAWHLQSRDEARGLYTTVGLRLKEGAVFGMGEDGSIVYTPALQAGGPMNVRRPGGTDLTISDRSPDEPVSVQENGGVLWTNRMTLQVYGLDQPVYASDGGIWKVSGAAGWLLYVSEKHGVVLHPWSTLRGFSVLAQGDGWPAMREIAPGILRVAVSRKEGEQPGDVWVRDYDVISNKVCDPWAASPTWLPITPVDILSINAGSVPPPQPPPPTPNPGATTMRLSPEVFATFAATVQKFSALHHGTDDERREGTKRGVETLRARHSDRYVCKAGGPGNPPSKDAFAFVPAGPLDERREADMFIFDMVNGSTREAVDPGDVPLAKQWVVPTDTKDWLADDVPPLPGGVHKYIGGGNDTGICDVCTLSRFDAVHRIPGFDKPHVYDGGEQDTGLCDICQKPMDDRIHQSAVPVPPVPTPDVPPQPPVDPVPPTPSPSTNGIVLLQQILTELKAIRTVLESPVVSIRTTDKE